MQRRTFLRQMVSTTAMFMTGASFAREPSKANRPNIILIMADDIAYDNNFGAYDSDDSWTPRLDKMAFEGVKFSHCYSAPKCTPSRVKIMTGRSGIRNYIRFGALDRNETTFAKMLSSAGYKTFIAGKWQLDGPGGTETKDAGFDSWLLWNTKIAGGNRYWDPNLELNGKLLKVDKNVYGPDMCVNAINIFIKDNKKHPFFVYYPMLLVHSPFLPTPDSKNRKEKDIQKNFKDMVKYMDKCVGRIMDCLKANDLDNNTVVMFTTDNGTHRNIRYRSRGKDVFGKKGIPHDRGTHAPLVIHHPASIRPGNVCDDIVDFSDFVPTLAEIAGAKLPDLQIDGRSFWPQCRGKTGKPREWIYQYYWPKSYGSIPSELGKAELIWSNNKRHKLYSNGLFYDISKDREEEHPIPSENRSAEEKNAVKTLRAAIASMPATNKAYDGKPAKSGR